MKQVHERVRILSAFGDIRGSGAYRKRITDEKKQSIPFWGRFDDLIDGFETNHEYFLKHLGDGFLVSVKLNGKNGFQTIRFLKELSALKEKIDRLIKKSDPRPDGFRIHVAAGEAIQKIQTSGEIVFHGYHLDLIGTTIKTEVIKDIPFVIHASAKNLMSAAEITMAGFQFKPIKSLKVRRAAEKLYEEDMDQLLSLIR